MAHFTSVRYGALAAFIADPQGPIAKDIKRRADRVERASKRMVGVDSGRLRQSIHTQVVPGASPTIMVGSRVSYALLHHQGTRPHIIRPHLRQKLRFKINGRVVYATQVLHPGTRPNHYLTVPLERYARG
jgi:phage gpG-like protein